VLYDRYQCTLQMGGSDQWGNITAGCDLIRKLRAAKAHGLVMPLVTTSSGVKFGKTEAGAVWLDPALTSPFRFYQFWLNTDDRDVPKYLRSFTFLSQAEVTALEEELGRSPEKREAPRTLAREVTRILHGQSAVERSEHASGLLFGDRITELTVDEVLEVFDDVPSTDLAMGMFDGEGMLIAELMVVTCLAASKGEAARLVKGGGVYVNNRRVTDDRGRVALSSSIGGRVFVLRKGARQNHVVRLASRL
jgi:tyrosyl-tRNA synthetase